MILLTPGPANTTHTVKEALVVPDTCHREAEFATMLAGVRDDLLRLAGGTDTHEVVLFTGSGTCAVDAAISSAVPPEGRLLILANGSYGDRMVQMAEVYGVPFEAARSAWHEPLDVAKVANHLDTGEFTHVALVHHETSTGVLNPLADIAALCAERGKTLIVDAISSFAGIPVSLDEVPIGYLMASANKCLQGMPGISFVFVEKAALAALRTHPARSFYTSLGLEYASVEKSGQMRFTPAVQVIHALRQAVDETIEETLPGRFARYRANWECLVAGMAAQGFEKLLPDEHESGLLTSFLRPTAAGYDFDDHHDRLLAEGFVIYPAKAGYAHTFRLGNIGSITTTEIEAFLTANARVLDAMGVTAPLYPSTG